MKKKSIQIDHQNIYTKRKEKRYMLFLGCLLLLLFPFVPNNGYASSNPSTGVNDVAQSKGQLVRGIVVDAVGEPLVGVLVRVEGAMVGVSTDIEGRFAITLPDKSKTLLFNSMGFKEVKRVVTASETELKIVLDEDIALLDDIVVIGYGEQKKLSVTSSVSTIKGDAITANTPNLLNSMSGRITGLLSVQNTGEPGKNDTEFYIRGMSTFGGISSPLVMVDGVPSRSMTGIDPDEIESFTILKDASATSMYGAEGANGVILITTKRGVSGKTKISYRGEVGMNEPIRLPKLMNAGEIMRTYNDYLRNDNVPALFSDERIALHESQTDPDLYPDVDWYDMLKDNALSTRHTLTFTGGGQNHRFFISGGFRQDDGLYQNTNSGYNNNLKYKRYNVRSNVDLDITPSTQLKVNISGQYGQQNHPGRGTSSAIFSAFSQTPPHLMPMRYSDGTFAAHPGGKGSNFRLNPYNLIMESGYARMTNTVINTDFELRQDLSFLTEGLRISGKVGFDKEIDKVVYRTKTPAQYYAKGRDDAGALIFDQIIEEVPFGDLTGDFTRSYRTIYLEGKIQYDRIFADVHSIGGFLLYKRDEAHGKKGNADAYKDVMPFKKENVVGKVSYVFDRRYSVDLTFGITGSEQFAKGSRYGFFPAVGVAWNLSEEKFFPWKTEIPEFKIRASIGKTGNDKISTARFLYKETWTQATGGYPSGWQEGAIQNVGTPGGLIYEGRLAAHGLKWEEELKKNIGLDVSLFKGRLNISAEYFDNKRTDILLQRNTVSSVAGFRVNPFQNFGIVKNRGFELAVNGETKINDLRLSYLANFTYTKNKVVERDEALQPWDYMNRTGKELNTFNALIAERLYEINDFNVSTGNDGRPIYTLKDEIPTPMVGLNTPQPGDIKYIDRNKDGVINSYDYGYDQTKPRFPRGVYGFGFSVDYKGFYASAFFQGAFDITVNLAENNRFYPFYPSLDESNSYRAALDRWTQDNPSQDVLLPRLSNTGRAHNTVVSTWWMRSGSFLRFKDAEIGYEFKKDKIRKLKLEKLKIYLQAHNICSWDNIKFWDPEQRSASSGMVYPITRQFTLGVEITI